MAPQVVDLLSDAPQGMTGQVPDAQGWRGPIEEHWQGGNHEDTD
jgi:hypothetical protein